MLNRVLILNLARRPKTSRSSPLSLAIRLRAVHSPTLPRNDAGPTCAPAPVLAPKTVPIQTFQVVLAELEMDKSAVKAQQLIESLPLVEMTTDIEVVL
jgi:hypothetical protein